MGMTSNHNSGEKIEAPPGCNAMQLLPRVPRCSHLIALFPVLRTEYIQST